MYGDGSDGVYSQCRESTRYEVWPPHDPPVQAVRGLCVMDGAVD